MSQQVARCDGCGAWAAPLQVVVHALRHASAKPGPLAEAPCRARRALLGPGARAVRDAPGPSGHEPANLCLSSAPVLESLEEATREMNREPSPAYRDGCLTRKRSRGSCSPSSWASTRSRSSSPGTPASPTTWCRTAGPPPGRRCRPLRGRPPDNNVAWKEKARRFGYLVKVGRRREPAPGGRGYVEASTKALGPMHEGTGLRPSTTPSATSFPPGTVPHRARTERRDPDQRRAVPAACST